ncbi:MAG TPA: glycosyltransferase family 4 protein [Tepidisphaeraceae bacterium]|nr:glycosyltransferase family 4 protein [Tepidisphaeraceae bacterium]
MRILHLSTSDSNGGAARAAFRLHTGLKRLGHDSSMLVLRAGSKDPAVARFEPAPGVVSRLGRSIRARRINRDHRQYQPKRPPGLELFNDDRSPIAGELADQLPACDLINLHWVAEYVDHEHFFPRLPKDVPVVWRLADMAPLTGGCHYTHGCDKFTARCGACPQLGSNDDNDLSRQIWRRKSRSLASLAPAQLHLVGTSKWIAAESRRSSLLEQFPVSVIPNGLDTADFAPRDRGFSRDLWNIARDAKVILFIADSLENQRKGFGYLVKALAALEAVNKPFLVSLGNLKSRLELPVPHLNLGRINNDRLLSMVYSLADVFVMPSLQESFGQTVTESLACGTPVVAFDGSGPTDMVRPGVTGWLATCGDEHALRRSIIEALSNDAMRAKMSENCRRIAVEEYSLETQAAAYARLYERLIADLRRPAQQQNLAASAAVVTN